VQGSAYYSSAGVRRGAVWKLSVCTNAPEPVFTVIGYSGQYYVSVDGQRAAQTIQASAAGGYVDLTINLRGLPAGFHTIEFLLQQDDTIAAVKIPPQYLLITPPTKPQIAVICDSLGGSSPDGRSVDCYSQVACDWLGAELWQGGFGGSGYEVTGSGGETFRQRIPLFSATYLGLPDVVLYAGGTNDAATGTLQAEVQATVLAGSAKWPMAKHVVLGSWAQNNSTSQTQGALKETSIAAGALAAGAIFVPVLTDPTGSWITGSGTIDAPNGNGTSDTLFRSSDSTHWGTAGHAIIGRKVAFGVADKLGL
jgi:lysophospholipase L1-like esterase